jgi:hypothetical protein
LYQCAQQIWNYRSSETVYQTQSKFKELRRDCRRWET